MTKKMKVPYNEPQNSLCLLVIPFLPCPVHLKTSGHTAAFCRCTCSALPTAFFKILFFF